MWILLLVYAVVFVALALAAYLMTPKGAQNPAKAQPEINIPTTELGKKIMIVFGEVQIEDPSLVTYGDVHIDPILEYPESKKK